MEDYMEMQQTFLSANSIRIAIVPIGKILPSQFDYYVNIIKNFSTCELIELNNEYKQGPFPNRNWKDAKVYLNFETIGDMSAYLLNNNGNDRIFQGHRRIMGVIGIVLCHNFPDLFVAKKEFANMLKNFPTSIAAKGLAFEPMSDQQDLEGGNVVMIPTTTDPQHLGFYIKTQVLDLATSISKELEGWVALQKIGNDQHNAILATTEADKTADPGGKSTKKRTQGRWIKCKADYCLLSGSPKDALITYVSAIDQARSSADLLWLGGALEGWIAATLLDNNAYGKQSNPPQPEEIKMQEDIAEKTNEAVSCYLKRNIPALAVEALLKLARYNVALGKKKEVSDILMTAYETGMELPVRTKIVVCSAIGMIFKEIGYMRKFAFFIRETAVFYHKLHNISSAHTLLKMVAKYYQLQDLDDANSSLVQRTRSKFGTGTPLNLNPRRPLKDKTQRDWYFIQKVMLQNLVKTAKGVGDMQSVARYLIYMMKTIPDLNANKSEHTIPAELMEAVQAIPNIGFSNIEIDMIGLPLLKKVVPLTASPHLYPVATGASSKKSIWLYTPYQKKEEKNLFWVQNEVAEVKVELANPTNYELEIQSITLSTTGIEFEPYSVAVTIPPNTPSYEVVISGKPIDGNGVLEIRGVTIRCFNLLCEHPISEDGTGLTLKEFYYYSQNPKARRSQKAPVHKVNVVAALPLLFIQETTTNGSKLKLFEGQRHECLINIENIGSKQIDSLEMKLTDQLSKYSEPATSHFELAEDPDVFTWDKDLIQKHLPLMPGQRIQVPIQVCAKLTTVGGEFVFNYNSDSQPEFGRSFTLHVPLQVKPGLQVKSFNIAPCSLEVIEHTDFVPHREGICLVVCEVMNPTSRGFQLNCTMIDDPNTQRHADAEVKEIIVEPHCVKRIVLPLKRFTLDEDHIPPPRERKGQFVKSLIKYTPQQEKEMKVLYWYKHEISRRLHVQWRSLVLNTFGNLDLLHPMALTKEMVSRLKADIVNFGFVLNGVKDFNSTEVDTNNRLNYFYPIRQFKTIGFTVTNISPTALPVHIRVQPFQDLENGTKILSLGGKFAWNGSLEKVLPELPKDGSYTLNLTVCFLASGTYKFLITCEDTLTKRSNVSEALKIEAF